MVVELLKTCLDMNRFEEMWKEALFRDAILLADLCVSACVLSHSGAARTRWGRVFQMLCVCILLYYKPWYRLKYFNYYSGTIKLLTQLMCSLIKYWLFFFFKETFHNCFSYEGNLKLKYYDLKIWLPKNIKTCSVLLRLICFCFILTSCKVAGRTTQLCVRVI